MNEEIIATLNKILPVVERVHSDHHPELHEVAKLYHALLDNPSKDLFENLRIVTSDYTVPADACQTYEKTYRLLSELDKDFQ